MDHYRAIASNSTSLNRVSDSNSAHKHQQNQSETTKIKQPSIHRPSIHWSSTHRPSIHRPSNLWSVFYLLTFDFQTIIYIFIIYTAAKLRCSQTFVFNEESAFQSSNQNQAMTVHFIFEFVTDWPLEEFYRTHTHTRTEKWGEKLQDKE